MKFADSRAEALYHFRRHAEQRIKAGTWPINVMYQISADILSIQQELMIEHDMPGVRYWYLPESESYWATTPGEPLPTEGTGLIANLVIELTRPEFLGRQKIYLGVGNNLI